MRLEGRRVVVTGGSSGIGRATARALAGRGAAVLAVARDPGGLARTAEAQPGITTLAADLTTPEGQRAVFERARTLDALVNDAGVGWVGLVEDMPLEEIDRTVALNVTAVIRLTRLALDHLSPGGHVVNIGSVLGWVASPPLTVYAASKFAVHGFTQGLRRELRGRGVAVTEIAPGPVDTAFFDRATSRPGAATVPRFPAASPERVAAAVRRCLERPGWPGYRTVAVPRWAGATRLAGLPGAYALSDLVGRVTRSGAVLDAPGADPG